MNAAAERFMSAFKPALHAYGTYKVQGAVAAGQKRKGEAFTKQGAISVAQVAQHLAGHKRFGFVPIHDDGTCWYGAIDIDKYDLDCVALAKKIASLKLPLILCKSKSGGAHLYLFLKVAMQAALVQEWLAPWSADLGYAGVEIFPKQKKLGSGVDIGNWINAPYCGDECHALDESGRELSLEEFLARVEQKKWQPGADTPPAAHGFNLEAAVAVLAPHWTEGKRDKLTMAVTGALLRHGVTKEQVIELIARVAEVAGDEEAGKRLAKVEEAARRLAGDRSGQGIPRLREYLADDAVADAFLAACGIDGTKSTVTRDDFCADLERHEYIFIPTRAHWPASSVNAQLPPVGKVSANVWLDRNQPVHQVTWAPGHDPIIRDKLVADGGWIDRDGMAVFNLYRPPTLALGNPRAARPWLKHVARVYPNDARHIISWLAHRHQRPGEKINHALVLGGDQGIGKDTILEPVKHGVGPWNFAEVSPTQLVGRFNGFVKSVILRVSEARDLGEVSRYGFYEATKTLIAAPPDVLRCDEKNLREHAVFNVCGVAITSNHKEGGIYLQADDRRHFVAWSECNREDFPADYWQRLYAWYAAGGIGHVAAYLTHFDLSKFDPKAPPPKTAAFWAIVDANRAPEDAELADVMDKLVATGPEGPVPPAAVTLQMVQAMAPESLQTWLRDRRNNRQIPHRMTAVGYVSVRNPSAPKDGLWKIRDTRQVVYARKELNLRDQIAAAEVLRQNPPEIVEWF